jgi:hypothetical protein
MARPLGRSAEPHRIAKASSLTVDEVEAVERYRRALRVERDLDRERRGIPHVTPSLARRKRAAGDEIFKALELLGDVLLAGDE